MMTVNFFELITFLWTDNQFLWTDNFIGTCIWLSFEHVWTKYINFCLLQWRIGSDVRPPTPSGVFECHRSFLWWYSKEMKERRLAYEEISIVYSLLSSETNCIIIIITYLLDDCTSFDLDPRHIFYPTIKNIDVIEIYYNLNSSSWHHH